MKKVQVEKLGTYLSFPLKSLCVVLLSWGMLPIQVADAASSFSSAPGSPYKVSTAFRSVVGDVNGDGKPDIVIVNFENTRISVLLAQSTGSFAAPVNYTVSRSTGTALEFGDVNSDGRLDMVMASDGLNVSVRLGQAEGDFAVAVEYPVSSYTFGYGYVSGAALSITDMNGDGKPDIVLVSAVDKSVSVLTQVVGGFATAVRYAVGTSLGADTLTSDTVGFYNPIAIGDVSADGLPDIVIARGPKVGLDLGRTARALFGQAGGGFAPAIDYTVGGNPVSVAISDIDGDGKRDIITLNNNPIGVSVLLQTAGGFAAAANYGLSISLSFYNTHAMAIDDMNGDGVQDIVVAGSGLKLLLGQSAGGFTTESAYAGAYPEAVTSGDMNDDRKPDIVTANYDTASVLLNKYGSPPADAPPTLPPTDTPPTTGGGGSTDSSTTPPASTGGGGGGVIEPLGLVLLMGLWMWLRTRQTICLPRLNRYISLIAIQPKPTP